ncbi:MAG: single-stranded DNA-binding protein [Alphaproteobacteria bacterium]|jgi:single-stranded DNA-binding protein|nr:single-stranded DNA-binding protein [Alphaproteobacteria bacterium]
MAKDKNEAHLVGYITNIEVKKAGEKDFVKFSVGINESYIDKDKNEHKKTTWHNASSFNTEVISELKTLDSKAQNFGIVRGNLEHSSYEKDGTTIYTTAINVKDFEVADKDFASKNNSQTIELKGILTSDVEIKTTKKKEMENQIKDINSLETRYKIKDLTHEDLKLLKEENITCYVASLKNGKKDPNELDQYLYTDYEDFNNSMLHVENFIEDPNSHYKEEVFNIDKHINLNSSKEKTINSREFATFTIATDEFHYKDKTTGEWNTKSQFHDITVFDKATVESLKGGKKGQSIELKGNISVSEFEKEDGSAKGKQSQIVVRTKDSVKLLEKPIAKEKTLQKEQQEVEMDR